MFLERDLLLFLFTVIFVVCVVIFVSGRLNQRKHKQGAKLGGRDQKHLFLSVSRNDQITALARYSSFVQPDTWHKIEVFLFKKGTPPPSADTEHPLSIDKQVDLGNVKRGQILTVVLAIPGVAVEPSSLRHEVEWTGAPCRLPFNFRTADAHETSNLPFDIFVYAGQVLLGTISGTFTSEISGTAQKKILESYISVPKRVFFSYSTKDRNHALIVAQSYEALGIEVFQDVLKLRSGEDWEKRLYGEIDRCDCFILFWSKSAAKSEWVSKEIEHAHQRFLSSEGRTPVILAHTIEVPFPPPPAQLQHLHFNDPILMVRTANQNIDT